MERSDIPIAKRIGKANDTPLVLIRFLKKTATVQSDSFRGTLGCREMTSLLKRQGAVRDAHGPLSFEQKSVPIRSIRFIRVLFLS